MTYDQLYKFISVEMQMSQVYQPVMLIEMLASKTGTATVDRIAKAILDRDPTQIDYYSEVVRKMPGVVLTKNRGITEKQGNSYSLKGFNELTTDERQKLVVLCEERIRQYEEKRSGAHWDHRRKTREPVSGTVRYEVLSRAKFRCELCGTMDSEKALEVDHIVPKNLGGADDISNYQALCYTCNAQKRDRDSTDFRGLDTKYEQREEGCLFCDLQRNDKERIVEENTLAYAIRDAYPVTKHHTLIIPKRHTIDFFGLTQAELNAINALLHSQKKVIEKTDSSVEGFNVGMNCGEIAGQSVWHCHVHLIPRRNGDVQYPKGGVRNIIAGKGDYSGNPLRIEELTEVTPNRPQLHLLKEYCRKNQRVCPLPHYWHEMYVIIAGHGKSDLPLPLILAAWGLSDEKKSARFMLHLDYSVSNGTLTQVDEYLRGLSDDQWYCG